VLTNVQVPCEPRATVRTQSVSAGPS
jgi:hypothetical protein